MAELTFLFDYEEFSSNPDRNLVFLPLMTEGFEKVTFQYQQYDASSDSWGEWMTGASLSLNGVTRVDAESASNTIGLNFADTGEGRYRAQLVATDIDGAESDLVLGLGYDTIVGKTLSPDTSSIVTEVLSVLDSGSAITTPSDVTLSISMWSTRSPAYVLSIVNSQEPPLIRLLRLATTMRKGIPVSSRGPEEGQYGFDMLSPLDFGISLKISQSGWNF